VKASYLALTMIDIYDLALKIVK